jgi:hypothetical protein
MDVENFDVAPDGWWDEDDLESREVVAPADSTSAEDSTDSATSEEDRILLLASQQYEDEAVL